MIFASVLMGNYLYWALHLCGDQNSVLTHLFKEYLSGIRNVSGLATSARHQESQILLINLTDIRCPLLRFTLGIIYHQNGYRWGVVSDNSAFGWVD